MNAIEIEEAVSKLAAEPFDAENFPFLFLEAFGNKETTIRRLRSGDANKTDLPGGLLQRNNIHIKTCAPGEVGATLTALRESAATARNKARFVLATDGLTLEAENLSDGETVVCEYPAFHDHFGFFLSLAGITTVRQIRENAFDIKATGRLNKLYIELLRENPDWEGDARREELNHFFARLIFCFFAEDTGIFNGSLFTDTIAQMSDATNTHEVLSELFRAMCTPITERETAGLRNWADAFPYVNGGLFSGGVEVPRFSRAARSYLLHVGGLDWTKINPDIFGSMIQAVADDEERGALGMHYTSVPNILKVLNPLFLDDLRAQLEAAGSNSRKLLNLRNRMARIRVFDPACGSGNFLVIAYKEMRAIEAEINRRRGEDGRSSDIPINNFRGIEIRHFSVEIARLALIIAQYQCDVLYLGPRLALNQFLPLQSDNWITCGNALRLDWLTLCPPTGTEVKLHAHDLFSTPLKQAEIEFENEGGETYICGNPPYLGFTWQSLAQKDDLKRIFESRTTAWKSLDYVSGWFMKAAEYGAHTNSVAAFVSTNSICQGEQVPFLWPLIFGTGHEIIFAHTSFKWANLASYNAGVTVVIIGISNHAQKIRRLFSVGESGETIETNTENINAYLVPSKDIVVRALPTAPGAAAKMHWGNKATDGGFLVLQPHEKDKLLQEYPESRKFIKSYLGSKEIIRGIDRYCLWIDDKQRFEAETIPPIIERIVKVAEFRAASKAAGTRPAAAVSHRFRQIQAVAEQNTIAVPGVSSESREYLPVTFCSSAAIISNLAFALYDAPLWNMALIASRIHLVWIATVCGKMKTDFRYSNTLGWNTFPVPTLTDQNKADLTRCAEDILLAREAHFPATIADLYAPDKMPADLRAAHERNDETLERIYIGRRFKNDTERLEKLFELYSRMTATKAAPKPAQRKAKGGTV